MTGRPLRVTLLALAALLFSAMALTRLALAVARWNVLDEMFSVWPGYLVLSGLVWFLAGTALAYGLVNGQRWRCAWPRRFFWPIPFIIGSSG